MKPSLLGGRAALAAIALLTVLTPATRAHANADPNFVNQYTVDSAGTVTPGGAPTVTPTETVGQTTTNGTNTLLVFKLPTLPAGDVYAPGNALFRSPGLTASLNANNSQTFSGSLYGLAAQGSNYVNTLGSDYFAGTGDPNATLLTSGLLTPSTQTGGLNFNGQSLYDYMEAQHTQAADPSNAYLIFRYSPDVAHLTTNNSGYIFSTTPYSEGAGATTPTLDVSEVSAAPEPGSLALFAVAGVTALGATRRRARAR